MVPAEQGATGEHLRAVRTGHRGTDRMDEPSGKRADDAPGMADGRHSGDMGEADDGTEALGQHGKQTDEHDEPTGRMA